MLVSKIILGETMCSIYGPEECGIFRSMEGRRQGTASQENDESNCAAGRAPDRITMERVTFGTNLCSQNIWITPIGDFCYHHSLFTLYMAKP